MESERLYSNKLIPDNAGLGMTHGGTRLQSPWLTDSLLFLRLHHNRVTLFPTQAAAHYARESSAQVFWGRMSISSSILLRLGD